MPEEANGETKSEEKFQNERISQQTTNSSIEWIFSHKGSSDYERTYWAREFRKENATRSHHCDAFLIQ